MRWFGLLLAGLLLPAPATAEETDSPFRGKLRQASDETGVVSITVPERWTDKERGGDILIRVYATGGGGHDIMVIREAGQGDVDALRDRYLEHDNGRYPGSSVEKLAEKAADQIAFTEEEKDSLAIAVTEAVNNAILHGNKQDMSKNVHVRFVFYEGKLEVKIRDEGDGFNPENVSDPLAPENLLKESGRGIFILSTLMDDVQFKFSDSGTEITLVKEKK